MIVASNRVHFLISYMPFFNKLSELYASHDIKFTIILLNFYVELFSKELKKNMGRMIGFTLTDFALVVSKINDV